MDRYYNIQYKYNLLIQHSTMANVKNRSRKSSDTKPKATEGRPRGRPPKKASSNTQHQIPEIESGMVSRSTKRNRSKKALEEVVKKRPCNRKVLTVDEKVQYLLQNGKVLKEKYIASQPIIAKRKPETYPKPKYYKKKPDPKHPLISKSGRLKKKTKCTLEVIDSILKDELMIKDGGNKNKIKKKVSPRLPKLPLSVNNNDCGISDDDDDDTNNGDFSDGSDDNYVMSEDESDDFDSDISDVEITDNDSFNSKQNKDLKKNGDKADKDQSKDDDEKYVTLKNGLVLKIPSFQCKICSRKFSRRWLLNRHMNMHLGITKFICPKCPRKFRALYNMQSHLKRIHKSSTKELLECQYCNKPFLVKESLDNHLKTHIKIGDSFKCIYCGKIFKHNILLLQHEQEHMIDGFYKCTLCDMNYHCRDRLYDHVKSHLKVKEFICQYCGKEFLRQYSMTRHLSVSHGGRRIVCPICKKNLKGHLTEHMRTHQQKRPHKCQDCGLTFIQSTQLNVHRRGQHTGVRPYVCRICTRPFSYSNALMLHIRRHTGEKPFDCPLCPLAFTQLPHMKAHMLKIHKREDPYKCSKCDEFFKMKADLKNHEATCTEGNTENSDKEDIEVESTMTLSHMRFLLALLLTMVATADKLKILGFNKRLIDDLLIESLEAMGQTPCKDKELSPLMCLRKNIEMFMESTVPKTQMETFKKENRTTEYILEMLTNDPDAVKQESRKQFEL